MKKLFTYAAVVAALGLLPTACTDLTEVDPSNLSDSNFPSPSNEETYKALAYRPIGHFREFVSNQRFWLMLEGCTDEVVVPTRGGGWFDANKWRDLHYHEWTKNHPTLDQIWQWAYTGVNQCNNIIVSLEVAQDFPDKAQYIAQVQTMRAMYYFWLMEAFGNVPIITATNLEELGGELPSNNTRAEVYAFILEDLEAAMPNLPAEVTGATYGVPTKWMAKAMQAKLYLNAEIYAGISAYAEAEAICMEIINSGLFGYDDDFFATFAPENGPQNMEIIWAMVNDAEQGSTLNFWKRFLPGRTQAVYNLPSGGWGGHSTLPEFYELFDDTNDVRNQMWQAGPQFLPDGSPLLDGNGEQIVVNPELPFGEANPSNPFDVGDDLFGANSIKYGADITTTGPGISDNDYVIFRYADIVLMAGEAKARQGGDANLALTAVNEVRTQRGAAPFATLTFEELLAERGREFAFEHWRRNDLIRFGAFENSWGLKTSTDATRRLFPIPQRQIDINPNLTQNPGY
ncbi:RagB/SusD family nutrient uptake outer membrane protein [Pontibacter sp. G13]|uniref:RagB/SusD family nutrient uptake outer membrane protein n=1 Tax=Pontibacter sp. G13 TaxID=3074898 RepID=UPI00288BACE8|nr:RagB/SusD family nutrient uptake outer membrane protein [Pontibacter sp. G13]WNJ19138.1 RagB/SusD family nutrient uptake outer membrane protein [Pontibacter sp. G13]